MDEGRYALRRFRDTDYEAVVALHNAAEPEEPISTETLRHQLEELQRLSGPLPNLVVTDCSSDELVGNAGLYRIPFEDEPTKPWGYGMVLPGHQGRGIGSYLYDAVLAETLPTGTTGLRCTVGEASKSGRAFLAKRGFVERRRVWRSSLDVSSADTSALASLVQELSAQGIELTTLAREGADDPAVQHGLHVLDNEAGKDVPHLGTFTPISFEGFRRLFLETEHALPEAWILAKVGERYVGESYAARETAQPGVLQQFFTGTLREYRRRGIALALKLNLIDFAKRNGYMRIETSNDSLNAPMWSLNQRLGFQKVREQLILECDLSATQHR